MTRSVCLVTGATGFIGAHLVRQLLARNDVVHAIVRPGSSTARLDALGDAITLHRLDLNDSPALERCVTQVSPHQVYHLAANTRENDGESCSRIGAALADYIDPLMRLIDVLVGLAKPPQVLVRAGSIAEYGTAATPSREDRREYPATPYGARMLAATQHVEMLAPALPFAAHTARLALTYGKGQSPRFLVPALFEACSNDRPIIIRRPDDRRDLIHVSDVVDALMRLGERQHGASLTLNIATGIAPSMREVAALVCDITGCDRSLVTFADPGPERPPSVLLASCDKARDQLGWSATINLEQGLRLLRDAPDSHWQEARQRCG